MKFFYRMLTLCICLLLSLALCLWGYNNFFKRQTAEKDRDEDIYNVSLPQGDYNGEGYKKIDITYGYQSLQSDKQRNLYNSIKTNVYSVSNDKENSGLYPIKKIHINKVLSDKDIAVTLYAFFNDHPEVFWLANNYATYIGEATDVQFYSNISSEDIRDKSIEVEKALGALMKRIPRGLNEYDRELKIHDILVEGCSYDHKDSNWRSHSVYGALVKNLAVCEGYSKAMQYLLSMVGIASSTVSGMGNSEQHQWNVVKINDQWYHLDVTWDSNSTADNRVCYNYFNVDEKIIKRDHEISKIYTQLEDSEICASSDKNNTKNTRMFNIFLPECNSSKANFYVVNAVLFDGIDEECTSRIEAKIQSCAENREKFVYIKVSESLDYNDAVKMIFEEGEPCRFFKYIDTVNKRCDNIIKLDKIQYWKNDTQLVISIELQYN